MCVALDCSHFEYAGTMALWRAREAPEGAGGISRLPTKSLSASAGSRLCPSLSHATPSPRPGHPLQSRSSPSPVGSELQEGSKEVGDLICG